MIRMYPKAFACAKQYQVYSTSLCCSWWQCISGSTLVLHCHCPEACLLHDIDNESTFDVEVEWTGNEPDVVAFLGAATSNALLAFFVCVHQTLITVPPSVITHIRQEVPGLFNEGSSINY
jgi:hypothetical protein